jgi:hypothetical protein
MQIGDKLWTCIARCQVCKRELNRAMVGPEAIIIRRAFGAPGDWGYGTPIGEALRQPG